MGARRGILVFKLDRVRWFISRLPVDCQKEPAVGSADVELATCGMRSSLSQRVGSVPWLVPLPVSNDFFWAKATLFVLL